MKKIKSGPGQKSKMALDFCFDAKNCLVGKKKQQNKQP